MKEMVHLVKEQKKIETEEIRLLRQETYENELYFNTVEAKFMGEREQLSIELNCVRDRLAACEEFYNEMHDQCQKEY